MVSAGISNPLRNTLFPPRTKPNRLGGSGSQVTAASSRLAFAQQLDPDRQVVFIFFQRLTDISERTAIRRNDGVDSWVPHPGILHFQLEFV